eukprot:jgi/Ulvmu1/8995/UM005_0086.1
MQCTAARLRATLSTAHQFLFSSRIVPQPPAGPVCNNSLLRYQSTRRLQSSSQPSRRRKDTSSHPGKTVPRGTASLVERLQSVAYEHAKDVYPEISSSPADQVEEFSMEYFRAQEKLDTSKLRTASFEDIGVPQQAAWYSIATGEPLEHGDSGTLVFVHSVNRFHAASVETVRGMTMLLRPEVLAVQLHNDMAPGIVDGARQRLAMASGPEHVQRVADGYQRICMGMQDTSDLNPDHVTMQRSYAEGRSLAALHQMEDYQTVVEELAASPAKLQQFKEQVQDPLLFRDIWHAAFLSGMTPWEHLDRHIVDAADAGRRVELVDMPLPKLTELAQQMFGDTLSEEDEHKESQGFFELMHEQGRKSLPLNLPEEVWHIMSPAAMSPSDMRGFYDKLFEVAPYTFELMKCRAAYIARALDTLASEGTGGTPVTERHVLCLVDRVMEPLVRLQWDELQISTDKGTADETFVSSLPFLPKPIQRSAVNAARRKKR